MAEELNQKQKMFADEYVKTGNAAASYQKIYKTKSEDVAKVNASRLLTNANVISYIKKMNEEIKNEKIVDMQEIKEFWSNVIRDKFQDMQHRLKASEFVAKTNAAFVENHNISGSILVEIVDDLDGDEENDEDED